MARLKTPLAKPSTSPPLHLEETSPTRLKLPSQTTSRVFIRSALAITLMASLLVLLVGRVGGSLPAAQWIPLVLKTRLDRNLYLFDTHYRLFVNLTKDQADEDFPLLSPDSQTIMFSSGRSGGFGIYLYTIATGDLVRLTSDAAYNTFTSWSSDGQQIAFVSGYTSPDIYVISLKDRTTRRMTDNGDADTTPNWSPDGRWIAYVGGRGRDPANLYAIDAHCLAHCDTDAYPLTSHNFDFFPSWSPDGKHIAYISDQGGLGIYLMDTNCLLQKTDCLQQRSRLLTSGFVVVSNLIWSADGQQIIFLNNQWGTAELYAVNVNCDHVCVPTPLTAIHRSFLGWRF